MTKGEQDIVGETERKLMPDINDIGDDEDKKTPSTKVPPKQNVEKPDNVQVFEGGEAIEAEASKIKIKSGNSTPAENSIQLDEIVEKNLKLDQHSTRKVSVSEKEKANRRLDHAMRKEARYRLKFEDTVESNQKFKTLHYGLKPNHERNVAVIHPIMYLLRRIVYALVIVFMSQVMFFGVIIVMFSCLGMLVYVLHEWQWKDRIINQ